MLLGPCAHGTIGAFYFYAEGSRDDPAFGFATSRFRFRRWPTARCGSNSTASPTATRAHAGVGARHPLKIAVMAKDQVLAVADWHFADVICGHADPMNFATDLDIASELFTQIDRIELQETKGESRRVRLDGQARASWCAADRHVPWSATRETG